MNARAKRRLLRVSNTMKKKNTFRCLMQKQNIYFRMDCSFSASGHLNRIISAVPIAGS